MIVGRIAVREVAANCGLASHEWIGDHFCCVGEYRKFRFDCIRRFELVFTGQSADFQMAVVFRDIIEARNAIDIDDVCWRNESQFHHRYEALAAGEQLGIGAQFLKQRDRLIKGLRREVLKAPRYHRVLPSYIGLILVRNKLSAFKREGPDHTN